MKDLAICISFFLIFLAVFQVQAQKSTQSSYFSLGVGAQVQKTNTEDYSNYPVSINYIHQLKSGKLASLTSNYFKAFGDSRTNYPGTPTVVDKTSYEIGILGAHLYLFSTKVDKTWKSHGRVGLSLKYYNQKFIKRVGHEELGIGIFGEPYYKNYTLDVSRKKRATLGLPLAYILNFHPTNKFGLSLVIDVTLYLNKSHHTAASLMLDIGRLRSKNFDK